MELNCGNYFVCEISEPKDVFFSLTLFLLLLFLMKNRAHNDAFDNYIYCIPYFIFNILFICSIFGEQREPTLCIRVW